MFDSATGADAAALISLVLANAAWGSVDAASGEWALFTYGDGGGGGGGGGGGVSVLAPRPGLVTYTQYVNGLPFSAWDDKAATKAEKARRKALLHDFVRARAPRRPLHI